MSAKRAKTKTHLGKKIQCNFEYNLTSISFYVSFSGDVRITYENNQDMSEYEISSRLLKLYYDMIDMEIPEIQKLLKIKITSDGITDKNGEKVYTVLL